MNTLWVTKDKKKIALSDMTDQHLLNTHNFLMTRMKKLYEVKILADKVNDIDIFKQASAELIKAGIWADRMMTEIYQRKLSPKVEHFNPNYNQTETNLSKAMNSK